MFGKLCPKQVLLQIIIGFLQNLHYCLRGLSLETEGDKNVWLYCLVKHTKSMETEVDESLDCWWLVDVVDKINLGVVLELFELEELEL